MDLTVNNEKILMEKINQQVKFLNLELSYIESSVSVRSRGSVFWNNSWRPYWNVEEGFQTDANKMLALSVNEI